MTHLLTDRRAPGFPVAGLDRRFYAFVIDRVIAWGLLAAACWAAYHFFLREHRPWPGITVIAAATVAVWALFAVALGASGATPGKALAGLRAVHYGTGTPIGVPRALLRGLVLAVATIPTFGIGLATLAWTSVTDARRQRRGWHDQLAHSVVVDIRPQPVEAVEADLGPRHVVNLTALRLVPAPALASVPPLVPARPAVVSTSSTGVRSPGPSTSGPSGWLLMFDTGERVPVEGLVLVGRRPQGRPGETVGYAVALSSQDMSLSKTHAQVSIASDAALVVMDRGSTNGSVLTRQGVSRPLSDGKPATLLEGDVVQFGDRTMEVSRTEQPPA
jgi:uncharacterized RDD family membrane protein YckC